ncbi:calcium-binding protein [Albibacillus kandeliae]|uniref:calcium-binding protein n=1 Tax=Albibacillus kandeliae TaxID=2174228 RepID=UPI001E5E5FAD|nr:heme acquisition protein HasA [Albibacillus kandeliae]
MAQRLLIDASALAESGFDITTYFSNYFADAATAGSMTFYGGTPDSAFGGTYYMNGSQVLATYEDAEEAALDSVVVIDGEDLAYDFIHYGSTYGHGITGEVDSVTFGDWVEGETTGEQGTGEDGEIAGLATEVVIDNLNLSAEPGSGSDATTNAVYALYKIIQNGDADGLKDLLSGYDVREVGTSGDDVLKGFKGNDLLIGGDGDDRLLRSAGDDILRGGDGNDILKGGRGDDVLKGNAGNDRLVGDAGNDTLVGGRGDDVLIGGEGEDTFVFAKHGGSDVVRDFTVGEDTLDVSALGVDSLDDFAVTEGGNWVELSVNDVSIRLVGLTEADLSDDIFAF